ncbi:MAG: inositol monophosphatase [Actinomycetales bacterium]|nr:MAG: inositol monophosphatase [Actinomycetales bacterium]
MSDADTDEVLQLLHEVAADVVLPRWRALAEHEIIEKNPGDLVTVADREAEVAITRWLRDRNPDALIVGEEACSADPLLLRSLPQAEHAFTVDPVDGTKNFVRGSPDFGVMVAELRGGLTVRAWIWQPVHRIAIVAERGSGARRYDPSGCMTLRCPPAPSEHQRWRLATSAYRLRGRSPNGLPALVGSWVSCAIDYPHLVAGDATALLFGRAMPWDHAAGTLVVTESGGVVTHLDGRPYLPTDLPDRPTPWQQWLLASLGHRAHEPIRTALATELGGWLRSLG